MAILSNNTSYFPDQRPGLSGNIFRPPLTPGASHFESTPYSSTPYQEGLLTRKRSRTDSTKATTSAVLTHNNKDSWTPRSTSPAPLANTRYTLAGGFDTPTLAAITRPDDVDDLSGERGFRKIWGTEAMSPAQETAFGPLARERNGKGRTVSTESINSEQRGGWGLGSFVLGLVGGVAGKMWHFCRENAFRGFYAGNGQGYEFSQHTQLPPPMPGRQFSSDFYGDFEQDNTPIRPRPAKRQHTDTGNGWVMVNHNEDTPSLAARNISSGDLNTLGATRASSRRNLTPAMRRTFSRQASYTGTPQASSRLDAFDQAFAQADLPASTASTASTRSPIVARPPIVVHHRAPAVSRRRSTSTASRPGTGSDSPMSPDTARFLNKKGKQDRDADKSMRKMSRQVQELIRQGQAALGTKFEVQGDADDFDEDWEDAAAMNL